MAMAAAASLPQRMGALPVVRRFKRSNGKRVSWASADQLCQIRMFLAEDAPFLAGVAQEQLQVKSSTFMHMISDLPPGFGGAFGRVGAPSSTVNVAAAPAMKNDVEALMASVAPAIPWQFPQKVELDSSWHVEAGEGSHEVGAQKQRESTTLEALYPRSSAIPHSPVEPLDQGLLMADGSIPIIPVTAPDEDSDGEEAPAQVGPATGAKPVIRLNAGVNNLFKSSSYGPVNGSTMLQEKDLSSGNSSSSSGDIDTNLLLQLLANPSLVATLSGLQQQNQSMVNSPNGNLVNQAAIGCSSHSSAATLTTSLTTSISSTTSTTSSSAPGASVSSWLQAPEYQFHQAAPPQAQLHQSQAHAQQMSAPPGFQQQQQFGFQQQQQQQGRSRDDEKYFKELIMQHGGASGGSFGAQSQSGNGHQHQQQQQQQGRGSQSHHQNQNQNHHHKQQSYKKGGNGYHHPPGFGEGNGGRGRRVCAYFGTAKGCRNGMKCPFIHEMNKRGGGEVFGGSNQQQHKRMRGFLHSSPAATAAATAGSDGDRF